MMIRLPKVLLISLLALMVVACGAPPAGQPDAPTSTTDSSYPAPVASSDSAESYPGPTITDIEADPPEPYPPPQPTYDESKQFIIDEPIAAAATVVSGTGLAGTPIKISSVSNVGETLGLGMVDPDGTFRVALSRGLDANETVAVQLSDDSMIGDFADAKGASDIPLIGYVLDMASVRQ